MNQIYNLKQPSNIIAFDNLNSESICKYKKSETIIDTKDHNKIVFKSTEELKYEDYNIKQLVEKDQEEIVSELQKKTTEESVDVDPDCPIFYNGMSKLKAKDYVQTYIQFFE